MARDHAIRFYVAVGLGVVAATTAIVLGARRETSSPRPIADGGSVVAWCADRLTPIVGGGCFAAPPIRGLGPAPLVVYLHGRYTEATVAEELARQSRVASLAMKRGFAVLALRGKRGQCVGLADFWCWPSNEKNATDGPSFVAAWAPALADAERRLGGRSRRLLFGFSNGAYFATLIATRALAPFDAIAIAHGGPVLPTRAQGSKIPLLLETADDDPSNEEMIRLSDELHAASWPHAMFVRDGGHELPDADVEAALTFFARTEREKLPLTPPISPRLPRRTPPDAGESVAVDASVDAAVVEPALEPAVPADAD